MDLADLIEITEKFNALGWSVQEQLKDILTGEDLEEQNPNALKMIQEFLEDAQRIIPEDIQAADEAGMYAKEIEQFLARAAA